MNFLTYWKEGKFDLSDYAKIQTSKVSKSFKDKITNEMMSSATIGTGSNRKDQSKIDLKNLQPII